MDSEVRPAGRWPVVTVTMTGMAAGFPRVGFAAGTFRPAGRAVPPIEISMDAQS